MAKRAFKAKEPIRLREKELSNGNKSLYLDIYREGKRSYEFLKLYLIPETASNPIAKERNKQTIIQANTIKAQRIIELTNGESGVKNTHRSKMLLFDWLEQYKQIKSRKSDGLQRQIRFTQHLLRQYKGDAIKLADVDKSFCEGFLNYIQNEYVSKRTKKRLTNFTARNYYRVLNCALNVAVRAEIIAQNPLALIESDYKPNPSESQRVYLTIDEVKALIETDFTPTIYKQAFLFSCFCGLRFSDVQRLRWENIADINGQMQADIRQKKTDEPIYLPLSKEAVKWLPERPKDGNDGVVFKKINNVSANILVKRWAEKAGIIKHISFHTARHTFATMILTMGADLYTTSKLMGHKNISTTQIYAKIVDQKKTEAVSLLNGIF